LNSPRYLIYTEHGYAHRLCAKAASMEPEEILEWERKADAYEVRDAPPTWAVVRARREKAENENREKDRQAHLSVKKFWVDGHKMPAETEVPGSGAYNAKYGFER